MILCLFTVDCFLNTENKEECTFQAWDVKEKKKTKNKYFR